MNLHRLLTRKLFFIFLITILVPSGIFAQIRVTKIPGTVPAGSKKGMIYALPRTVLVIDLYVTRVDRVRGPYAEFAREYLGIDNHISSNSTSYLLDKAAINSSVEADPDQFYLVEREEKSAQEIWMAFTENGLIMGAENKTETATLEGFEKWDEKFFTESSYRSLFPLYAAPSLKQKVDTIIRKVSVDTAFLESMEYHYSFVQRSDRERAEEAIAMINRLEQDKYNLLVGYQETAYSKEAIEYMANSLEELKQGYLKLFTGIITRETLKFSFRYVPAEEDAGKPVAISGFNRNSGLVEAGSGDAVNVVIRKSGTTGNLAVDTPVAGPAGYYYRIPEPSEVEVETDGAAIAREDMLINQFGVVRSLSPNASRVEFHPATGAIKSVVIKD